MHNFFFNHDITHSWKLIVPRHLLDKWLFSKNILYIENTDLSILIFFRFSEDIDDDTSRLGVSEPYVLQESGPLVDELSQLRDTITKNYRFQAQSLKQSTELQQKIARHLDHAAQRENNALKLQQARIEQQNEIIKQMRTQNVLLQKLLDRLPINQYSQWI